MISNATAYIVSQLESELKTLPGRSNEIVQHLLELGYISLQKTNAIRESDIALAKEKFLDDVLTSDLFENTYIEKLLLTGHDFLMSTLLRQLTDIDEGMTIEKLPLTGEVSLKTRLIHYRLDIFGLWPLDIAVAFSSLSLLNLKEIAGYAGCNELEALNLIADIEKFTTHLLKNHEEEKFILVFKSPKVSEKTRNNLDRRHPFKRQLIEDFGDKTDYFRYLSKNILVNNPNNVDVNFLQKEALDPFKKFVLRLIQVHQWKDGFYSGLLDSDMGEVTLKSMLDAIEFYNNSENRNIKIHRVLTYVHQGYFIFNGLFFLQEYMVENDQLTAKDGEQKVLDNILSQLVVSDEQGKTDFSSNMNKLKNEIYSEAEQKPSERKGFLQRIYFGVKGLIKKAFRFARKIFSWIKDKVMKMWGFLKTLFRTFFDNLAMGIRAFVDGINFLFGRKFIESSLGNEMIVSKFSIDGDSVSITSGQISKILETHLQTIDYNIKSMKFTLAVAGGILKLLMEMVSILTWPLLMFNIIKIYKNISASYLDFKAEVI
ncbi:MAG: hypothetical protein K9H16_07505 [Bacteroidales bacterium]|nr:hypothetical protein [Bacteroidales bacterium]